MSSPFQRKPAHASSPPKLLDRVRYALRRKHYSYRTEEAYVNWIRRYILFHNKRHPKEMGVPEIEAFLTHLAVHEKVAASTRNQALQAILFLYREVLGRPITEPIPTLRAKKPKRPPTVLTRQEVQALPSHLPGTHLLIAQLLYGSGLRLMECLRLRVKDLDLAYRTITVRDGKGEKDHITILPQSLVESLQKHLQQVRRLHEQDLAQGYGAVYLPDALARKYPNARREWAWQWVFPSPRLSVDPRSGLIRRHMSLSALQRAVRRAAERAGIHSRGKTASCPYPTPSATPSPPTCCGGEAPLRPYDIRTAQKLLGHKDMRTTMIYTHVLNRGAMAVCNPLD